MTADKSECTCSVHARSWEVVQSRYPCPVHPEPDLSGIELLPRIDTDDLSLAPIPVTCAACGNGPYARDCQFCGGTGYAPSSRERQS